MVSIKELANMYGVDTRKARKVLREEGIGRDDKYYWVWDSQSSIINQVINLLISRI